MESTGIKAGACYRDADGEVVRALEEVAEVSVPHVWRCIVLVSPVGYPPSVGQVVERRFGSSWVRVADPTPAVVDPDDLEEAAWEAARQERIDATARAFFVAISPNGQTSSTEGPSGADTAYRVADVLEGARERYIEKRRLDKA